MQFSLEESPLQGPNQKSETTTWQKDPENETPLRENTVINLSHVLMNSFIAIS